MCRYYWSLSILFLYPNASSSAHTPLWRPLFQITWWHWQPGARSRMHSNNQQTTAETQALSLMPAQEIYRETVKQAEHEDQSEIAGGRYLCIPTIPFSISPSFLQILTQDKLSLDSLLSLAGTKIRITSSSTLLQLHLLRKPPQAKMLLLGSGKMKGTSVHIWRLQWLKSCLNLTRLNWDNHPCLDLNMIF